MTIRPSHPSLYSPKGDSVLSVTSIKFLILGICLCLSAFFSGAETALFSLSPLTIKAMGKKGRLISQIMAQPRRSLITILLGNMFVNILASSLATSLALELFGDQGLAISMGVMTFLILIWGEITPKTASAHHPEKISLIVARPLYLFSQLVSPLRKVLDSLTHLFLRGMGERETSKRTSFSDEELKFLVSLGHKEGNIDLVERDLLQGIIELGGTTVDWVMTPRREIFSLEASLPVKEAKMIVKKGGFSRIPVWEDKEENIVGILYAKDFIPHLFEDGSMTIRKIIRPPYFIPEKRRTIDVLREFKRKRVHIALTINEYGELSGLVTMDDLLRGILGEAVRKGKGETLPYRFRRDGGLVCQADVELVKFNRVFGTDLSSSSYRTLGGYIMEKLGRIPRRGERLRSNGLTFHILGAKQNRIERVEVRRGNGPKG